MIYHWWRHRCASRHPCRGSEPERVWIQGALDDPTLELKDANGTTRAGNNDWVTFRSEIEATGLAPNIDRESALVTTLSAGAYTAIVRGANDTTGVALVEVYHVE